MEDKEYTDVNGDIRTAQQVRDIVKQVMRDMSKEELINNYLMDDMRMSDLLDWAREDDGSWCRSKNSGAKDGSY